MKTLPHWCPPNSWMFPLLLFLLHALKDQVSRSEFYRGAFCALLASALVAIGFSPTSNEAGRIGLIERPRLVVEVSSHDDVLRSLATETTKALKSDVTFVWPDKPEKRADDPPSPIVTSIQPVKEPPPSSGVQVDTSTYIGVSPEAREPQEPIVSETAMRQIDSEIPDRTPSLPAIPEAAKQKAPLPNIKPKPPKTVALAVPEPIKPKIEKRLAITKPKGSSLTGRRREDAGWQNYVAHVVSSGSRSEVRATLKRIRANQARLVRGLTTRIVKSNVDGSMVYTAGFGPLPTHKAAADLCRRLLAAGENDCVVWPPWSQAN